MSAGTHASEEKFKAYVYPFVCFMLFLLLLGGVESWVKWDHPSAVWWQRAPEQWLYPLQTLVCGGLLIFYRREYSWQCSRSALLWGAGAGIVGIAFWLLPLGFYELCGGNVPAWTKYVGVVAREEGFNPSVVFASGGGAWWTAFILRCLRAIVVVAFVEEIFWRGFLMRWAVNREAPFKVPFGTGSILAYGLTTLGFVFIHAPEDYLGAFLYGSLTYVVAVKTRSLTACIVMHAVANAFLCGVAMGWQKYGLW